MASTQNLYECVTSSHYPRLRDIIDEMMTAGLRSDSDGSSIKRMRSPRQLTPFVVAVYTKSYQNL